MLSAIQRLNQPDFTISPGEGICLPPGTTARISLIGTKGGISRWSHVSFRILGGLDVFTILTPPPILRGAVVGRVGKINAEWHEVRQQDPSITTVLRQRALGSMLLAEIAAVSGMRMETLAPLKEADRLKPVLDFIAANYTVGLNRERLAKLVGLSPSRFDALFRAVVGVPVMSHVQQLRLQEAQRLLQGTELPVKEIASRTGFDDPFHFSRLFKAHCGVSPQHYRTRAKSQAM